MTGLDEAVAPPARIARGLSTANAYFELTKPKIMMFLLLTGYCAMVVAARGLPEVGVTLSALFGLGLSTGGAAAFNMWYDRDIDAIMNRTVGRPIPAGRIQPARALIFSFVLFVLSAFWLGFMVNWLSALLSVAGFIYYTLIYTVFLKRRTPQNIVIGGGAGAFPPLIGWAAVTNHMGWPAVLMFLIIFLWTPPHFWALALFRHDDYKRANIPMMPVVRGESSTKRQMAVYTFLLSIVSLLLYWTGAVGLVYVWIAGILGVAFMVHAMFVLEEKLPNAKWARKTFFFSLLYLGVLFLGMVTNVT